LGSRLRISTQFIGGLRMFEYKLKIPKARVNVLIGKEGRDKKRIEEELNVKIEIKGNEITIKGEDSLNSWTAQRIVKAIARGFSPQVALLLKNENYVFDLLDIKDWVGRSKKALVRLKGRVIGREGKAKKTIEEMCNVHISIYGKTIAIIGKAYNVDLARKAIVRLLEGAKHSTVYRMLEKNRRKLKMSDLSW